MTNNVFPHTCNNVDDVIFILRHLFPKDTPKDCSKCHLVKELEDSTKRIGELEKELLDIKVCNEKLKEVSDNPSPPKPKNRFKKVGS